MTTRVLVLFLFLLASPHLATAQDSFWESIKGRPDLGDRITAIAYQGGNYYAGTEHGSIYRYGTSLRLPVRARINTFFQAFEEIETHKQFTGLLAGTDSGIFFSSNKGITWEPRGSSSWKITALTGHQVAFKEVYVLASTSHGLFRSTDAITWTPVDTFAQQPIRTVTANYKSIYAITANGVLWHTNDVGSHWTDSTTGIPSGAIVNGVAFHQIKNGVAPVVLSSKGMFKSTDAGATWIPQSIKGLDSSIIGQSPAFFAFKGSLFTQDSSPSYRAVKQLFPRDSVWKTVAGATGDYDHFSPWDGLNTLCSKDSTFYNVYSGGKSTIGFMINYDPEALLFYPNDGSEREETLYLKSEHYLQKSVPPYDKWLLVSPPPYDTRAAGIDSNGAIYIAFDKHIVKGNAEGLKWDTIYVRPENSSDYYYDFRLSSVKGQNPAMFVCLSGQDSYLRTTDLTNWTYIKPTGKSGSLRRPDVRRYPDVYVTTQTNTLGQTRADLSKSTDGGVTWEIIQDTMPYTDGNIWTDSRGTLYTFKAVEGTGAYPGYAWVSHDDGKSWYEITPPGLDGYYNQPYYFTVAPTDDIFLTDEAGNVYRSSNRGAHWDTIVKSGPELSKLFIGPDHHLYAIPLSRDLLRSKEPVTAPKSSVRAQDVQCSAMMVSIENGNITITSQVGGHATMRLFTIHGAVAQDWNGELSLTAPMTVPVALSPGIYAYEVRTQSGVSTGRFMIVR